MSNSVELCTQSFRVLMMMMMIIIIIIIIITKQYNNNNNFELVPISLWIIISSVPSVYYSDIVFVYLQAIMFQFVSDILT